MHAPTPKRLSRTTFVTSRLLDFASEKELIAQTGHDVDDWPLVIAKELFDNALDAGEETGIAPAITVKVNRAGITVSDNGRARPAGQDPQVDPRLHRPRLVARSLCIADARRARQRAQDHPGDAVRAVRRRARHRRDRDPR
jgi:hypothetical protein